MKINKPQTSDSSTKPLHQLYTQGILDTLKEGEPVKLEGENGSFVFYKNDKNGFGVQHNSAGIGFVNNPMTQREMGDILNPIISHADNFEGKISDDLLIRLKEIFWGNDEKVKSEKLTMEDLLKNISLDNVLSTLAFKKELLKETEHKISEGIVGYLENATNVLNELILQYPENSVIKNKIQDKLNYLESYKKTFSDGKFTGGIQKNISDLENVLDILENQDTAGELSNQIKELRNKISKKDFSRDIEGFFNKIYLEDGRAIFYFLCKDQGFLYGMEQGDRAMAELNGWNRGSNEINRLGEKQYLLMHGNLTFKEKEKAFENANKEYWDSVGFILGTGRNALPSTGGYYKGIHDEIEVDKFISMPCSDVYPAVLQKTILPFYLEDLFKEACELLGEKSLDKSIDKYAEELKNPSGLAKLAAKFKSNDSKIESLKKISEKIKLLRKKFDSLDKQTRDFQNKRIDDLIIMASEFDINEEFPRVNNTNIYSPFTMSNQDKRLDFMRKN